MRLIALRFTIDGIPDEKQEHIRKHYHPCFGNRKPSGYVNRIHQSMNSGEDKCANHYQENYDNTCVNCLSHYALLIPLIAIIIVITKLTATPKQSIHHTQMYNPEKMAG